MKKIGLGKRVLACAASAATLLTGTTALSGLTTLGSMAASAASYDILAKLHKKNQTEAPRSDS